MSVAHIGKLQENTAALCRKISQNVGRTYREASGEYRGTVQNGCETLRVSAIRWSGYVWPGKLKRSPLPSGVRILDVIHPGGMAAHQNFGCHPGGMTAEHNSGCHLSGMTAEHNSGCHPSGMAAAGCKVAVAGWNEQDLILLVFWICLWIPKNSPQSRIALVIKKLSKHQNLTQVD